MPTTRTPAGLLLILLPIFTAAAVLELPNTSGIDGQLTENLGVDHFFSLWLVFNDDEVKLSDQPFTILAPRNSASWRDDNLLREPDLVKKLLLDHVVLGQQIDASNLTTDATYKTLSGKTVRVRTGKEGRLEANDAAIVESKVAAPNGTIIVLDNYLFPKERQMGNSSEGKLDIRRLTVVTASEDAKASVGNTSFVENIMQVLSFLKSGVRVFQHFLSRSNVSQLLVPGDEYTVFVPIDHAFQRWHPIDWGFYPFSVPEFTESVITNHFVRGRFRQDDIKDGESIKTLGNKDVVFRKTPFLSVNGASVIKGDTPVTNGNIMFISEVLFVSEAIVSRLHQQHRDKETPPLLAFPWFGAQFLSHAFLALERDRRFSHVTRFLNLADLAPHVSGTGYTFFVPVDGAFEAVGLDKMPDNYLSTGDGLRILLNHFVKGRLYDKDLKDGSALNTLGNKTIHVTRKNGVVYVNEATIVESEVFVYNLGTMFYIDRVLFAEGDPIIPTKIPVAETTTEDQNLMTTTEVTSEAETVSELETDSTIPEVLFADATVESVSSEETTMAVEAKKNVTA